MKHSWLFKLRFTSLLLSFCSQAFLATGTSFAREVEVIPVFVYQGESLTYTQIQTIQEFRAKSGGLHLVHAISPVYAMNRTESVRNFIGAMNDVLRQGDGVVMHVSPLRKWLELSGTSASALDSLYGKSHEKCYDLCGIESSMSEVNPKDIERFVSFGMQKMSEIGLGKPESIVFEEGLVSREIWNTVLNVAKFQDWSGFHVASTKEYLSKTNVYAQLVQRSQFAQGVNQTSPMDLGRRLDFIRFGLYNDVVFEESIDSVIEEAMSYQRTNNRRIEVPIFVNVGQLGSHSSKLGKIIATLRSKIEESGNQMVGWSGSGGSSWSRDSIAEAYKKYGGSRDAISTSYRNDNLPSAEKGVLSRPSVEVVDADLNPSLDPNRHININAQIDRKLNPKESVEDSFIPALQSVTPSHVRDMTH
ncbi:MAG: hypothetical protein NT027_18825 [Proteobacteria bacterium]|nr:hypothetical protein [Pseudomonadota bacterium]